MDSTPTDSLNLSHVTVWSISNWQFSIPIKVETVENTAEITALVDCGAEGLFIDKSIAHKWRKSILKTPIKVRNVDGTYSKNGALCYDNWGSGSNIGASLAWEAQSNNQLEIKDSRVPKLIWRQSKSVHLESRLRRRGDNVLQTVRTPTLCIPDMSDRPGYFLISLSNLATSLITYGAPCVTLLCSTFIATLLYIWRRPYPYFRISFIH